MDNPELVAALILLATNAASFFKSHSDVKDIKKNRTETAETRNAWQAVVDERLKQHDKRLDEGSSQFLALTNEVRANSDAVNRMAGSVEQLNKSIEIMIRAK